MWDKSDESTVSKLNIKVIVTKICYMKKQWKSFTWTNQSWYFWKVTELSEVMQVRDMIVQRYKTGKVAEMFNVNTKESWKKIYKDNFQSYQSWFYDNTE